MRGIFGTENGVGESETGGSTRGRRRCRVWVNEL